VITPISGRAASRTGAMVMPTPRETITGHAGPSTRPPAYLKPFSPGMMKGSPPGRQT
jgi:hypothetical protein